MRKKRISAETKTGYIFLMPAIFLILLISFYPTVKTIYLSFRDVSPIFQTDKFVGLYNFKRLMMDPFFKNALKNTFYFTTASVGLELIFGIILALVMNKDFRLKSAVRVAVLVPWAIPTIITSQMWKWIFNTDYGVMNFILLNLHIVSTPVNWLGDPTTAMWCIISADTWKTTTFIALLVLAGLQVIPKQLYESAKIDGANAVQIFYKIVLPIISPTILIAVLLRTLDAFRVFDLVYVLTNGGPANGTEVLSSYTYKVLFNMGKFGYGSILSVVIFLILLITALVFFYLINLANKIKS